MNYMLTSIKAKLKKISRKILRVDRHIERENYLAINRFSQKFEIIDFRFIDINDLHDLRWGWWSRIYEYPIILENLKNYGLFKGSYLHNTCWGYEGGHIIFKNALEQLCDNVTNSDLRFSEIENTMIWDSTSPILSEWHQNFDFVLNISTLEEIDYPQIKIFESYLKMLKEGGYFLATFDIPGLQLNAFETLFNCKIVEPPMPINGSNSGWRQDKYADLKCGLMTIKKLASN